MKPLYVKLPVLCRTGVRDAKGFERQHLPQLCQSRLNDQMEGTSVASLVLECSATEDQKGLRGDLWQAAIAQRFGILLA